MAGDALERSTTIPLGPPYFTFSLLCNREFAFWIELRMHFSSSPLGYTSTSLN
jgi:hypothetical protein